MGTWAENEETDAEFEARYLAAVKLGEESARTEPHAQAITFNSETRRFFLRLINGTGVEFEADHLDELRGADAVDLAAVEISPGGSGLGWRSLDVDISVPDLVMSLFGGTDFQRLMRRELNRQAGRVKSEARAQAARENGRKGGRPSKKAASH
jgi:hypothetical protein